MAAVIGSDDGAELRVDLETGHVSSVDPDGELPTRLMNSSVGQLARTIAAYVEYSKLARAVSDEAAARRRVQDLRRQIETIDTAAAADSEAWWSVVLEQTEDGLL